MIYTLRILLAVLLIFFFFLQVLGCVRLGLSDPMLLHNFKPQCGGCMRKSQIGTFCTLTGILRQEKEIVMHGVEPPQIKP